MLTSLVISSSFVLVITARSAQLNSQEPPVETNPDCTSSSNNEYVYRNCTFVCQLDEVVSLTDEQPCQYQPQVQGICVNGTCIALPKARDDGNNDSAKDAPPKCDDQIAYGNVHKKCSYSCGDEMVVLSSGQACLRDGLNDVTGKCVEGECTAATGSPNEPAPLPQPESVPEPEPEPKPEPEPQPQPEQPEPAPQPESAPQL
uniref:Putative gamma-aminobutyric acid gaba-a receptor subunit epsilon n=1 Tax=Amblyomma triste TaxID=251400 RepID=A0A023G2V2_AMBTT